MRYLILFSLLAFALHAEDAKPLATVEQLQKLVAEQKEQIAKLQQKLTIYQRSAWACQDAMLDAQIDAQAKVAKEKSSK